MQPAYLIREIRPAAFVRPAGQVPGRTSGELGSVVGTFNPVGGALYGLLGTGVGGGISPGDANLPIYDADGNLVTSLPDTSTPDTSGKVPTVEESAANAGMSQADQTALFDTVASGLNTAGETIAAIINSGNAVQIAQLQSQTALQIAALNQQAQQAQASGNTALASRNAAQAAQMAQFQRAFLMQPQSKTGLYIVAGVVVLGIIGAFVYLGASTRAKANPSPIQRLTMTERQQARQHLKSRRGKSSAGGFKVGDAVHYNGAKYVVYDFDSEPKSLYGASATLISSNGASLLRDVDIAHLR